MTARGNGASRADEQYEMAYINNRATFAHLGDSAAAAAAWVPSHLLAPIQVCLFLPENVAPVLVGWDRLGMDEAHAFGK